jgi:serine/threonine protein kinase
VVFYAYKDLALVELARKQLDVADEYFRQARQHMPTNSGPYYQLIWDAAYAELLVARRDAQAAEWLQRVIVGFADAELPDFEICARLALAKTWTEGGYSALAERCLGAALKLARSDGYTRYLAPLNEAMLQLDLVEGVLTETGRQVAKYMTAPQSYVVRSQLGAGAFGDVFRVYDSSRGEDFALKRLRLSQLYDTQRRRVVLNSAHCELEAGSRVRHPGVARVWAIGTEPTGDIYVLQDFIAGTSLSSHLPSDTSAPLPGVLATLAQLAFALQALHDAGVVHRDLKPGNVLMPAPGRPVLVDFGIAHIPSSQHCDPDHLAGTLPYMAPEQALGKNVNAQADLYSLGVIAYQWLSGTFPLHLRGETFAEMICDLTTRPPAPLSDFRPDVPDDVEKLVMSLLAKKPRRRPPTAAAVAQMFTDYGARLAAATAATG